MIKIYRAKDYITMPWRNGQGSTSQLIIEPRSAQFPDDLFTWRLSSAPILNAGEFSRFPGYDRCLMLTSGSGLKIGDALLNQYDSHHFSGDDILQADLPLDPCRT
jgi:environmental stress-induced protein Ves